MLGSLCEASLQIRGKQLENLVNVSILSEYVGKATFMLTLLAIVLILIFVIPLWKEEKTRQFVNEIDYAGYMRRFLASLIDTCIWLLVLYVIGITQLQNTLITKWQHLFIFEFLKATLLYGMVTFFLVKYGGASGKLLLNIKIISIYEGNISIKIAIMRQLLSMLVTIVYIAGIYYALSMYAIIGMAVEFDNYNNFYNFQWDAILAILAVFIANIFRLVDYSLIIINKRRRAIHDFLAGTIVVQRSTAPSIGSTDGNAINVNNN